MVWSARVRRRSASIRARALQVGYRGVAILPPLSLDIGRGELWAVVGPNGAGKSTFVRTLLGLLRPTAGEVAFAPAPGSSPTQPQQGSLDAIFPVSVLDFVLMGRQGPRNVLGRARAADREAALAALAEAGAAELAAGAGAASCAASSGGQRQRVLMARALVRDADVIFLDEPTNALDLKSERDVLALIEKLRVRRSGAAVMMVTHLVVDALERADHALPIDRDHGIALATPAAAMREARLTSSTNALRSLPRGGGGSRGAR